MISARPGSSPRYLGLQDALQSGQVAEMGWATSTPSLPGSRATNPSTTRCAHRTASTAQTTSAGEFATQDVLFCIGNTTVNARNAILTADMRILGEGVVPFTTAKQNAVIVGVSNVLGDGIVATDILLTVLNSYDVSAQGPTASSFEQEALQNTLVQG